MKKSLLIFGIIFGVVFYTKAQEIKKVEALPNGSSPTIKNVSFIERLSMKNAQKGQKVFDVSVGAFYVFDGSSWILGDKLGGSSLPVANLGSATNAITISTQNTANVLTVSSNGTTYGTTANVSDPGTIFFNFGSGRLPSSNLPNSSLTARGGVQLGDVNGGHIGGSWNALTLLSGVVSSDAIANDAINSSKILAGSIENSDILDNSITPSKLALGSPNQILRTSADGTTAEWADAPAGGGGGSGFLGTYTAVNRATSDAVKDSLNLNNGTPADVNITGLFGQAIAATDQLSSVGLSFANNTYTNNSGATVYVRVSTNITFRRNYIDNAERLVWLEYLPNGGSGVTVARANSKGVVLANQTLSLSGVTLKLANGDGFAIKARSAGGDATNPVFVGGLSAVDNLTIDRVK